MHAEGNPLRFNQINTLELIYEKNNSNLRGSTDSLLVPGLRRQ